MSLSRDEIVRLYRKRAALYDFSAISRAAAALAPAGRLVILDLKKPEGWPMWLVRLGVLLTKPFGVSLDIADRRPWEAVKQHAKNFSMTDIYGGFAYIAVGKAPKRAGGRP